MSVLIKHDWPGNVRELQNALERAMNTCRGYELTAGELEWMKNLKNRAIRHSPDGLNQNGLIEMMNRNEKNLIIRALEESGGNKSQAARLLKISRTVLYKKMKRLGIVSAGTQGR